MDQYFDWVMMRKFMASKKIKNKKERKKRKKYISY